MLVCLGLGSVFVGGVLWLFVWWLFAYLSFCVIGLFLCFVIARSVYRCFSKLSLFLIFRDLIWVGVAWDLDYLVDVVDDFC